MLGLVLLLGLGLGLMLRLGLGLGLVLKFGICFMITGYWFRYWLLVTG